jgi:aminoglycoside 3-N-acetyltransferase
MNTCNTLAGDLRRLGLRTGATVMVHASLRKLGPTVGGADAVIDALVDVLGPDGTLVMPLGSREGDVFEALVSPSDLDMGVLPEVFRCRRGTHVNDHAAARFAASGPRALELLEPIPLHDYYGPGSPLQRFSESGGEVLRLGANVDTVTVTHWAEYLADVPDKRQVRRRYVRADVGEQFIDSLDDCDGITQWKGGEYFSQVLIDYVKGGHARVGTVGQCTAELFDAAPFVAFAVDWMERHLR